MLALSISLVRHLTQKTRLSVLEADTAKLVDGMEILRTPKNGKKLTIHIKKIKYNIIFII
jgi:hypothetical protein